MTTQQLAGLIVGTEHGFAPPPVIREAQRSLLNWLGVAIGASGHPIVDVLLEMAAERGSRPQSSILGRGIKVDQVAAALVNGAASHIFDYDDTFLDTILHPSAPVIPAALALAEAAGGCSGRDLLESIIIGIETAQRVAQVVYPSHYDRGWHITGSVGAFGAAAAAGWLLDLEPRQLTMAFGLAATQPVGLREMFGTATKPYHPGKAAANGLEAALLAAKGFTSSLRGIEAPRGFAHVTSESPRFERLTDGWGRRWQILDNSYKPFPCGVVIHPAIDAATRLRSERGIAAADVERLQLDVHPLVLELTGKTEPKDGLEAKFSVYHCAAAALLDGRVGLAQFADSRVLAADVLDLRRRVTVTVDAALLEDQVRAIAYLRDGGQAELFVEHCAGSRENPLGDAALEDKFRQVTRPVLPESQSDALAGLVRRLDGEAGIGELIRLCSPAVACNG